MLQLFQHASQLIFSLIIIFCSLFDTFLLVIAIKNRKSQSIPFVYIIFMSTTGWFGKVANLLMINALVLSSWLGADYEKYREYFGKQVTLLSTFAYLTPLCLNWLMTVHRVSIFLFPFRSLRIFSDLKTAWYCGEITLTVLISLLIPYYSSCSLNFFSPTNTFISACGSERHTITKFQNDYTIYLPFASMFINFGIICYLKFSDTLKTFSKFHEVREKAMIRQAVGTAVYLSIYEFGYQLMRIFPKQYADLPIEIRTVIFQFRLTIVCSINFLVYFVETKSTRMITQIPVFHVSFQLLFCVLAFFFLFYDSVLLMATISHKNDPNVPFPYIVVMCVTGIVCKIAFITDFVTYLVLPYPTYFHSYRNLLGREFTLMGTLTYFIPLCVSALMTLNRLFLVVRPTNTHVFGRNRIFLYSFGILVLCLTLLLIPYFSYCPVNFLASTLVFVTGCAPERHPVTRFTNLNAIWVPITILVINSALVVYLKTTRVIQKTSIGSLTVSFVQSQKKREHMLTRQTVALAIYLSFYEVGSFLMRTFPEPYASLPYYVKDGYFYFRLETICAINFFVYFMENSSTRKMVRKFFGNRSRKESTITYGGRTSGAHKISVVSHNLMF